MSKDETYPRRDCHILIMTVCRRGDCFYERKADDLSQEKNLAGLSHL